MTIEREVLVSALKLTSGGPAEIEEIARETRIPAKVVRGVVKRSSDLGIVQRRGSSVVLEKEQRLSTAVRAITLGADVERVSKFLTWSEFEDMSVLAFEANDFVVKKHFRFKWSGRRWEIDLLGFKEPIIASVDCKHWRHGWRGSASRTAAEKQVERTRAFTESSASLLDRMGVAKWRQAYFVPAVLSLVPSENKSCRGVPIVPVLQLRDFLQTMPAYIREITHFQKSFPE